MNELIGKKNIVKELNKVFFNFYWGYFYFSAGYFFCKKIKKFLPNECIIMNV